MIPESVRWLLTKNRREEAIELILRVAKENNVAMSAERVRELLDKEADDLSCAGNKEKELKNLESDVPLVNKDLTQNGLDNNEESSNPHQDKLMSNGSATADDKKETSSPSVLDLFRYPNLRKKSLNIFFSWCVNSQSLILFFYVLCFREDTSFI